MTEAALHPGSMDAYDVEFFRELDSSAAQTSSETANSGSQLDQCSQLCSDHSQEVIALAPNDRPRDTTLTNINQIHWKVLERQLFEEYQCDPDLSKSKVRTSTVDYSGTRERKTDINTAKASEGFTWNPSYVSPLNCNHVTDEFSGLSPPSSSNSLSSYPGTEPSEDDWKPEKWQIVKGSNSSRLQYYTTCNVHNSGMPSVNEPTTQPSNNSFLTSQDVQLVANKRDVSKTPTMQLRQADNVLNANTEAYTSLLNNLNSSPYDLNLSNINGSDQFGFPVIPSPPEVPNSMAIDNHSRAGYFIVESDKDKYHPGLQYMAQGISMGEMPIDYSTGSLRADLDWNSLTAANSRTTPVLDATAQEQGSTTAFQFGDQARSKDVYKYKTLLLAEPDKSSPWSCSAKDTMNDRTATDAFHPGMMVCQQLRISRPITGEIENILQLKMWNIIAGAVSSTGGAEHRTILDEMVYDSPKIGKNGLDVQYGLNFTDPLQFSEAEIRRITFSWARPGRRPSRNFFRYKGFSDGGQDLLQQLESAIKDICSRPPRRNNRYPAYQLVGDTDRTTAQVSGHGVSEWRADMGTMNARHIPSSETRRVRAPKPPPFENASKRVRRKNDIYDARWVKGEGKDKAAWCENCEGGGFHLLKNSGYLYHKNHEHGIFPGGKIMEDPLEIRPKRDRETKWEGLCGICYYWIDLDHSETKQWGTWFRHYKQCAHEYDEFCKLIQATPIPLKLCELEFIGGRPQNYLQETNSAT